MNTNRNLERRIEAIEREIARFARNWVGNTRERLQTGLDAAQLERILAPGMDLIGRGGKRWRPLLMLLCCELAGGGDRALAYTPVVEIAHNGTLIADDIEDNSTVRRGGQAVHLKFGLDMALNTANFMCFLPSLSIEEGELPPEIRLLMYKYYLEDMRHLHIGQGLDIQWHNDHNYIPSREDYLLMCSLKTGTLARMAARLGILVAGGEEELALATGKICEDFGVGFQILDDVKNLTTGNPGKKPGDDIIEGKKSLPVILLSRRDSGAMTRLREIFREVPAAGEKEKDTLIAEAIAILRQAGCLQEAREEAEQMISQAKAGLQRVFPPAPALSDLLDLFAGLG